MDGTVDAQRTDVQELPGHHAQLREQTDEPARGVVVDVVEVLLAAALRRPGTVDDIVPCPLGVAVAAQLLLQPPVIAQVQLGETDTGILQPGAAAGRTHACPGLHPATERLFDQEASDEAAGSGDEYLHFRLLVTNSLQR